MYFQHLKLNMKVASRCAVLAVFHAVHGVVPVKWTEHSWWGIPNPKT